MKKRYEVKIRAEKHNFALTCDRPSEAYEALCDAADAFKIKINRDEAMDKIARLGRGELLSAGFILTDGWEVDSVEEQENEGEEIEED